jgi:hypothetical protein
MTTMAGALSRACGYATIDSTDLPPYFTVTHSRRRGDLSTAWRAQSCAQREATPKPVAATPLALPSRNRLLETVRIFDLLLWLRTAVPPFLLRVFWYGLFCRRKEKNSCR